MKKKILSSLIFLGLILLIVTGLSKLFTDKKSGYYKSEFFNARTGFDALFFGASRMHEAADPVYLWEKYGISSYNLASSGESIQMTYFVLREALDRCSPRAVFIDASKISDEPDKINSGYGFVHESIDALPLNKNKLEAVDYAGRFFDGGKLSFLSMMYAYHDRYDDLKEEDFKNRVNYDKGAYIMTSVYKRERPVHLTDEEMRFGNGDGIVYYKKILELCRERGVLCVLTDIPVDISFYDLNRQKKLNGLKRLTEEMGGAYIGFNEIIDEVGIDYEHDFGDKGHLNFLGAEKVCDYLADFLKEKTGASDHRDDSAYSICWEEDIQKWKRQKTELLEERKDAVEYLFWAADESRDIRLYAKNPEKVYDQYAMDFCLQRLNIVPQSGDEELLGGYDLMIGVTDRNTGQEIAKQFFFYNQGSGLFSTEREE